MKVYLALGSNLGNRRDFLRQALILLKEKLSKHLRLSPIYEYPALLPSNAPEEWNRPFLNVVGEWELDLSPLDILCKTQEIERILGRNKSVKLFPNTNSTWSPRTIDIDLLLYGSCIIENKNLIVPHPGIYERSFVLDPLSQLIPNFKIPKSDTTVLELARQKSKKLRSPVWIGIVNITPDSFSDGLLNTENDCYTNEYSTDNYYCYEHAFKLIDNWVKQDVMALDFGAESTRPGAKPLDSAQEWSRLEPVLKYFFSNYGQEHNPTRPFITVDTKHWDVAEQALSLGVDGINDVSGLTDKRMIKVIAQSLQDKYFIIMHNLGLPADPNKILPSNVSPVEIVNKWMQDQILIWESSGLDLNRIILDPGIGFGKNKNQSLFLLQNIEKLLISKNRLLVGHSRKSFLQIFCSNPPHKRDSETLAASLQLANRGVDMIRVHTPVEHQRAWLAWMHLQNAT